jgi:cytochrome b involved in lipid metabolism
MITCIQNIFKESDYNTNIIKKQEFYKHSTKENAWIKINKIVYSIRQDDNELLELFKDYYGKDVKEYINTFELKQKITVLNMLEKRIIGKL